MRLLQQLPHWVHSILGEMASERSKTALSRLKLSKFLKKSWNLRFSDANSMALFLINSRSTMGYVASFLMG